VIAISCRVSHHSQDLAPPGRRASAVGRRPRGRVVPRHEHRHDHGPARVRPAAGRAPGGPDHRAGRLAPRSTRPIGLGTRPLLEELAARGVDLISPRDGIDLSTPAGRMMAGVLSGVAVYEIGVKRGRQPLGTAEAKGRRVRFGPKPGSRPGIRLNVTPEQEVLIRRLNSEGAKVAAIARMTGPSRPTAYSCLAAGHGASSTADPPRGVGHEHVAKATDAPGK